VIRQRNISVVICEEVILPIFVKADNFNYSLKHALIHCIDVADVRQSLYNVNSLNYIKCASTNIT